MCFMYLMPPSGHYLYYRIVLELNTGIVPYNLFGYTFLCFTIFFAPCNQYILIKYIVFTYIVQSLSFKDIHVANMAW